MPSTLTAVFFTVLYLSQNIVCYADCCGSKCNQEESNIWDTVKKTVADASENKVLALGLKTAAVAGAAIVGAPVLVSAAGFGAGGIAAGSVAAAVQGTWFGGTIAGLSGGVFAGLQSIGAAGLGIGAKTAIVTASGTVVTFYESVFGKSSSEESEQHCIPSQTYSWFPNLFSKKDNDQCCSESKSKSFFPSFF